MSSQDESASSSDTGEGGHVFGRENLNQSADYGYKTGSSASTHSTTDDAISEEPQPSGNGPRSIIARAYQLEMFQASMQQNIIVSMDTGSGKTQVAVLRIRAELERTPPEKRVWFLAPTVALCAQQYEVIRSQIKVANSIVMTGDDNVDSWSDVQTWDAVLANVRVVVCTYMILFEALSHAFVTMDSISLLVMDEAHNCTGKFPGRLIMKRFYMPRKSAGDHVPHILGLTASPVMKSDLSSMEDLESSLDSVCRGPTLQREELFANVHQPTMTVTTYKECDLRSPVQYTRNMNNLHLAFENLDIAEDPYVLHLMGQRTPKSLRELDRILTKLDTYTQNQMKALQRKSSSLFRELGQWAVDSYIYNVVEKVSNLDARSSWLGGWLDDEQRYLHRAIQGINALPVSAAIPAPEMTSIKLQVLLRILRGYEGSPVGIVFVKERATAGILSQLLAIIPDINARYKVGCMVGTSRYMSRKMNIHEVLQQGDDLLALEKFRSGAINLLVATSVLEEGIDVPVCNLVICFDMPANLKSFIQRRGRARMRESKLHLMIEEDSLVSVKDWGALEAAMKQRYENDMRELDHLAQVEEEDEMDVPPLHSRTTAAKVTVDDAKGHLEHFCRVVTRSQQYVDASPEYLVTTKTTAFVGGKPIPILGVTVLLPASLPPNLRQAHSSRDWISERNAKKDAALQAYKMLYEAGLINEHLLPIRESDFVDREVDGRPGLLEVQEQWNPWPCIVEAWETGLSSQTIHRRRLQLTDQDGMLMGELDALLPVPFPPISILKLYWIQHSEHPWTISFDPDVTMSGPGSTDPSFEIQQALDQTQILLDMAFGHRFSVSEQSKALRFIWPNRTLKLQMIGGQPFSKKAGEAHSSDYIIRSYGRDPYIYKSWVPVKPPLELVRGYWKAKPDEEEPPADAPWVVVKRLPKNCGFVKNSRIPIELPKEYQTSSPRRFDYIIPEQLCTFDTVPATLVQLGMLVPSITQAMEPYFVAQELLRRTALGSLDFKDIDLVMMVITSSSAGRLTNYERVEFLGDAVLKLGAAVTCATNNLHFPEGYLSLLKDRLVSNSRLCKAATALGLDQFIITRQYSLKQWRNMLTAPEPPTNTRKMSSKTLADVTEALIGAAYIEGGMSKALRCISLMIPNERWRSLDESRAVLYQVALNDIPLPSTLGPLEELLGYSFNKKSLLIEAITHASYNIPGSAGSSLERLEFLGDSVLDFVVVARLFSVKDPAPIEHYNMHLLRTAVVNGEFLGFLAMEWRTAATQRSVVVRTGQGTADELETVETPGLPLFGFLRHNASGDWVRDQQLAEERHAEMAPGIRDALEHGQRYPWDLLARLRISKVHSDVLEAVIGAVWVDSGSLEECEKLIERVGILRYLDRALRDGVKILHPKEELGRVAQNNKVVYKVDKAKRAARAEVYEVSGELAEGEDVEFLCSVTVGDRCVARVGGAVSKNDAMTKAALEVIRVWEEAGRSWDNVGVVLEEGV
ncbi:dicer-like protein 2 [Pyricularia oryzae 70-15]|uniref:Dicer-like protein 2 n=4 Tax=Pyricularia oryzae TaxID=318829 RepID=DCL2_PYRO7|nr:dicer-like protein 2 [Pyricularia oryzae 70-15]A4RHU9.3 RecName: Full=Dicer-like protein 2; Includes: RecName: Full=Endoribonuclease DCL2; Includes: RecName: Full=ATP-dependent helicase DCL2 [Pyricularia oryzae 70-15]ELQ37130.1 hypothetical protein OOU_Y34scaffold00618g20 [Pyricularia oryzae Y34]KAI7922606.1 dicer-like protein 2 [Pyricularia oryzae]EHA55558.1 dicer-like protein 2 [Pyricularia oryzae 70-15]KAI7924893.1 dicer-like protein 2 [Pyricularia oryzae]UXG06290.1 dicer-like protein 2